MQPRYSCFGDKTEIHNSGSSFSQTGSLIKDKFVLCCLVPSNGICPGFFFKFMELNQIG